MIFSGFGLSTKSKVEDNLSKNGFVIAPVNESLQAVWLNVNRCVLRPTAGCQYTGCRCGGRGGRVTGYMFRRIGFMRGVGYNKNGNSRYYVRWGKVR
jgi:hypothetical protein